MGSILIKYHKNIFSQSGQDGILQEIFKRKNNYLFTYLKEAHLNAQSPWPYYQEDFFHRK
jgi:hypothetical protein